MKQFMKAISVRKTAAGIAIAAGALFSLTACASLVVSMMSGIKAPNLVYLHKNPQPGDYALYENEQGTHQMRREIVKVHKDLLEIRTTFPKAPAIIASLQDISFRSKVRPNGTVLEAYMVNSRKGVTTRLAIADPGDYNYIGNENIKKLPVPETITTRKGTYRMDMVVLSHQSTAMPGVQSKTTSVWYFHPEVKFGLVRQHNIMESDASIVEIAAFINNLSPVSHISRSLSSYIIEKSRHHTYTTQMDLVDSN